MVAESRVLCSCVIPRGAKLSRSNSLLLRFDNAYIDLPSNSSGLHYCADIVSLRTKVAKVMWHAVAVWINKRCSMRIFKLAYSRGRMPLNTRLK